ncbi:MAG: hypothetical protein EKK41_28150, partial [Hyphomicrobiales bacterium]
MTRVATQGSTEAKARAHSIYADPDGPLLGQSNADSVAEVIFGDGERDMMRRRKRDQGKLFYEFRPEDRIQESHLLRRMNVFVTAALADLNAQLEPFYSDIGRPSVDPELMIRMLLIDGVEEDLREELSRGSSTE